MKTKLTPAGLAGVLLAGALALSGCSAAAMNGAGPVLAPMATRDLGVSGSEAMFSADAAAASPSELGSKITVNGDAQVITGDPAGAAAKFTELVKGMDGTIDNTWESDYDSGKSSSVSARVPADRYEELVAQLPDLGKVESQNTSSMDLTQQYIDVNARKQALEDSLRRVKALADEATSTAELLQAEDMIAQQQGELDSLNQQLEWLDQQVDMSTLTVTFSSQAPGSNPGVSFGWIGDVLLKSLYTLAWAVVFLVPWAVIALVVWLVIRGLRRRGRKHRYPAPERAERQAEAEQPQPTEAPAEESTADRE
ncbi:DUF4349 domain-containing protein [Scrofimicrobium sp. R131]|uniref:DUF4349 domain-containing protein n=1 Tax=Scrofimicrobium appendicitidis TaxID=3079930 RepID=A0AAU7V983_9ACTO